MMTNTTLRRLWPLAATLCSVAALGACSSSRLGGMGSAPVHAAVAPVAPAPDPVEAIPSAPVVAEPLPPLGGPVAAPAAPAPLPGAASSTTIASLPPEPAPSAPPVAPAVTAPTGRSALVGTWTAKDASGASCRVQLSSAPALDLYRASAPGCGNKDLARVSAWDYRDGEIYLYQPGGTVAARLRGTGSSLDGVLSKSGAPVTLSK